jgi:hypothetical protein
MKHYVPILDEGVTIDRGDHIIVVLDALDHDDVQREIADICALLAASQRQERRGEEPT